MMRGFINSLLLFLVFNFISSYAHLPNYGATDIVTECYTANGADYQGKQAQIESPVTHPRNFTPCMRWDQTGIKEFEELPENYCRNSNNSVFPWCFKQNGKELVFSLCDIPKCKTPAYLGCFKPSLALTYLSTPYSSTSSMNLIGNDTMLNDPKMKISRCLNFCRSRKYNFAGLLAGHSCYCGTWPDAETRDIVLKDPAQKLPDRNCLTAHCVNDPIHACGGSNAMAIYDTKAGMCGSQYWNYDFGTIYSPRWPGRYQKNLTCGWKIIVPNHYMLDRKNFNLVFSFVHFDLEPIKDVLEFYTFETFRSRNSHLVTSLHGVSLPNDVVVPLDNVKLVLLQFNSDHEITHKGFTLNFRVENKTLETITYEPTPWSHSMENKALDTTTNYYERTTWSQSNTNTTMQQLPYANENTTQIISRTADSNTSIITESNYAILVTGISLIVIISVIVLVFLLKKMEKQQRNKKLNTGTNIYPPLEFNNPVTFKADPTAITAC